MRRHSRGLGLLELLVALVLVTLASSLVMQGIGQGLGMLRRVATDQGTAYHELMARAWLRESIAAAASEAVAQAADDAGDAGQNVADSRPAVPPRPVFAGTAGTIEMQSFRPLLGAEGVATAIRWSADPQQGLRYEEGDQQVLVDALPPVQRIEYQGPDGNWQPQWPPAEAPAAESPQAEGEAAVSALPRRVRFEFPDNDRLDVVLLARHSARSQEEDSGAESEGADSEEVDGE